MNVPTVSYKMWPTVLLWLGIVVVSTTNYCDLKMTFKQNLDSFIRNHSTILKNIGLPKNLYDVLATKVLLQQYDAGEYLQFVSNIIENDESDEDLNVPKDSLDIESTAQFTLSRQFKLCATQDIKKFESVFLVDHLWTTTFPQSRLQLKHSEILQGRIRNILLEQIEISEEDLWSNIWPLLNCFTLPGDEYTQWYLLDEVGSAISHSNTANFKCVPIFVQLSEHSTPLDMSIMWPINDCSVDDVITRDFLPDVAMSLYRNLRMLAFQSKSNELIINYLNTCREHIPTMMSIPSASPIFEINHGQSSNNNTSSFSIPTTWSSIIHKLTSMQIQSVSSDLPSVQSPLTIYCDRLDHFGGSTISNINFTSSRIQFVETPELADILYLIDHTFGDNDDQEYNKLNKVTNQFWWNGMLVSKDHLIRTVQNAQTIRNNNNNSNVSDNNNNNNFMATNTNTINACNDNNGDDNTTTTNNNRNINRWPTWFVASYNLNDTQSLLQFMDDFVTRDIAIKNSHTTSSTSTATTSSTSNHTELEDNIWILKKYRGRQSIDYPITNNLSCVLRHLESAPRLACKYISSPVLLQQRKFDLRYYVLVHSLEPLVISRHNLFIVRLANKTYDLNDLEDYQKHFTLMNLLDQESLGEIRGRGGKQEVKMSEFIEIFDNEHLADSTSSSSSSSHQGSSCSTGNIQWVRDVQPVIDQVLRSVFESVQLTYALEPPHPSQQRLHPNSAWSLSHPNITTARAMYGVDIMLREAMTANTEKSNNPFHYEVTPTTAITTATTTSTIEPVVLEVQWAPDCTQSMKYLPTFWKEILEALYLNSKENITII